MLIIISRKLLKVSWMRKRDMHILSAGISTYTSDLRFQVIHPDKSENWTLQIKSPQLRDSGIYECQVSTEPKMSLNYTLNVVGECTLNYSIFIYYFIFFHSFIDTHTHIHNVIYKNI